MTQSGTNSNPFTAIDQPIIDIAQNNGGFLLLLGNGCLATASGITITKLTTNKRMFRIVRFGTDFVGLDRKGVLYTKSSSSTSTNWVWEKLTNFPRNVVFINSTNSYSNLEVLTCSDKAYTYQYSSTWKNGMVISQRKTKDFRYYGQNLNRFIDIDESCNTGKTNDGIKYKHVKAAGFFNNGEIITVSTRDQYTHVRVINNTAYFLFEQDC